METPILILSNKRQLKGCTNRYLTFKMHHNNAHYLYVGTDSNIYELIIPRHIPESKQEDQDEVSSFTNFKSLESVHL